MSAPFVGHRVEITGTSRADLNGKKGLAVLYDDSKGRYRVHVRGQDMYLKPSNLLQAKEQTAPTNMAEAKEFAAEALDEVVGRLREALPTGFEPRDAVAAPQSGSPGPVRLDDRQQQRDRRVQAFHRRFVHFVLRQRQ